LPPSAGCLTARPPELTTIIVSELRLKKIILLEAIFQIYYNLLIVWYFGDLVELLWSFHWPTIVLENIIQEVKELSAKIIKVALKCSSGEEMLLLRQIQQTVGYLNH